MEAMTVSCIFKGERVYTPGFVCESSDGVLDVTCVTCDGGFQNYVENGAWNLYWI